MFTLLNVLVFFLLTGYAFKLMFSAPSYVKLSKTEKVLLSGREKFLLLTMATGIIQVGVDLGVNLSAFRLMIWIGMILLSFVLYAKSPKLSGVFIPYILFLVWLAISLAWTVDIGYGIRAYLKYLYPFLIMLFAATFVRSPQFIYVAMRWMILTSFIASIFLGGIMTDVIHTWWFYGEGIFWPLSTLSDYFGIMSGVSFVMWWRTKEKKYLWLIVWFMLSAIAGSIRTGILAILLVMIVASYLRYRLLSLPYIAAIVLFALLSVVFIPQVHNKMFRETAKVNSISDLSSVSTDNIDSNARFAMWAWAIDKFYTGHEWTGSGLGSSQQYMYEYYVFGGLHALHNDYVQILVDTGRPGVILYLLFPIGIFIYSSQVIRRKNLDHLKTTALLTILSYIAVLSTMYTDNVVNYAFAAHSYPFIFIGIALAYRRLENEARGR
jgi:O-antigen ligase